MIEFPFFGNFTICKRFSAYNKLRSKNIFYKNTAILDIDRIYTEDGLEQELYIAELMTLRQIKVQDKLQMKHEFT